MTEEALAAPAPAPAPVPTEAAEAAPAKVAAVETKAAAEEEHAGAAPKTADDEAAAKAAPTTAPDETQEVAAAADAGGDEGLDEKKDPPPADSVISARLRELLEETDLEKTSGERDREFRMDRKQEEGRRRRRAKAESFCWLRAPLSLSLFALLSPFVARELEETSKVS